MADTPTNLDLRDDPGPFGSFKDIREAVLADMKGEAQAEPEAQAQALDPEPPALDLPAAEEAPVESLEAAPDPLTPAEILELTHRGQKIPIPKEQAIDLAQKGYDYTQKTQLLADYKRELDSKLQGYEQRERELATFLRDPEKVNAYAEALRQQLGTSSQTSEDIPTVGDLQQALRAQAVQVKREISEEIANARAAVEQAREEAQMRAELGAHISALTKKFPQLDVYDPSDLDVALRSDIAKAIDSQLKANQFTDLSVDQVKGMLTEAAKRRVDRIDAKKGNSMKMEAVRAAKFTSSPKGIEPPGGTAPVSAGVDTANMKVGSKELRAVVMDDIARAERARKA